MPAPEPEGSSLDNPARAGRELDVVLARLPERLREELINFFLDRADRCRSIQSRRLYAYVALSLARNTGIRSLKELDREKFYAWKRSLVKSGVSSFTLRSYIARLKALVRWVNGGELPSWLQAEKGTIWDLYSSGEHLRDKVLRPEEIRALIDACEHVRDKAIIAILWETGLRIGELLSLRLRDVEALPDGSFRLRVQGKTGVRVVAVIHSAHYLAEWLRARGAAGPDEPLWISLKGRKRPLTDTAFRIHLKRIAKRAGLDRPVHPHMLRHTAMTELARELTEQELKLVAGWKRTSRMAGVYVHLSGRDAEVALRKVRREI